MTIATSDLVNVVDSVYVHLELARAEAEFPILVTTGLGDSCILGYDFLITHRTKVDFKNETAAPK